MIVFYVYIAIHTYEFEAFVQMAYFFGWSYDI